MGALALALLLAACADRTPPAGTPAEPPVEPAAEPPVETSWTDTHHWMQLRPHRSGGMWLIFRKGWADRLVGGAAPGGSDDQP